RNGKHKLLHQARRKSCCHSIRDFGKASGSAEKGDAPPGPGRASVGGSGFRNCAGGGVKETGDKEAHRFKVIPGLNETPAEQPAPAEQKRK
ncbi:unnamed protein product, partial [Phaeothamnion confervicola]